MRSSCKNFSTKKDHKTHFKKHNYKSNSKFSQNNRVTEAENGKRGEDENLKIL